MMTSSFCTLQGREVHPVACAYVSLHMHVNHFGKLMFLLDTNVKRKKKNKAKTFGALN
jgi:hypothetical protein